MVGCTSPSRRPWACTWNVTHAWQVWQQSYSYLPSCRMSLPHQPHYTAWWQRHVCQQLAQGCYLEPMTTESQVHLHDTGYTHTTHNRFTALWKLSGTTRVSRYQKKHSLTTLIVVINHPYLLFPSTTTHGILHFQSTCSTVFFHNLSPSFLWSTSWPGTLHFLSCLIGWAHVWWATTLRPHNGPIAQP